MLNVMAMLDLEYGLGLLRYPHDERLTPTSPWLSKRVPTASIEGTGTGIDGSGGWRCNSDGRMRSSCHCDLEQVFDERDRAQSKWSYRRFDDHERWWCAYARY